MTRSRFPQARLAARAGFSLVEMLIVVSILGILILMTVPRIERALALRSIANARVGVANLFLRAKTAASATRQTATLTVNGTSAFASLATPTGLRFLSDPVGFQDLGVTVSASAASLTIQPTGLVISGTPYKVVITRSGVSDSVMITGYGMVK